MDTRTLETMKARDHRDLRILNQVLPLVFMSGLYILLQMQP